MQKMGKLLTGFCCPEILCVQNLLLKIFWKIQYAIMKSAECMVLQELIKVRKFLRIQSKNWQDLLDSLFPNNAQLYKEVVVFLKLEKEG